MAIPRSKLSDLLELCESAEEMLFRLREKDLLLAAASDDDILRVIREGVKETADEIGEQGFTWATTPTRVASKLSLGGYLNRRGSDWFSFSEQSVTGGGAFRRLWRRLLCE